MRKSKQLEKKQARLQTKLARNLERKRALDAEINREFEELKKIEISMEISSKQTTMGESNTRPVRR